MKSVRDLRGGAGTAIRSVGVTAGTVTADHLDPRVGGEPVGQGIGGAFGQQVERAPSLHVDQDRAVIVAPPEREIVDAQGPYPSDLRIGKATDGPQQRVLPDTDCLHFREPGAGAATERQGDGRADRA